MPQRQQSLVQTRTVDVPKLMLFRRFGCSSRGASLSKLVASGLTDVITLFLDGTAPPDSEFVSAERIGPKHDWNSKEKGHTSQTLIMTAPNMSAAKVRILGALCIFVFCGILVAGLWPFHHPMNQVTWLGNTNGLLFGHHGTVLSASIFNGLGSQGEAAGSLELWIEPQRTNDAHTLLAFSAPENHLQFSLHQSDSDLELHRGPGNEHFGRASVAYVDDVFHRGKLVFITITAGRRRTAVYLDGILARTFRHFQLSGMDFKGQLVVGTSPVVNDSWSGKLRGLAIYQQELTPAQVSRHNKSWKTKGRPDLGEDEHVLALYLFDEHRGSIVHDRSGSGIDLNIPERYMILHEKFLEPAWREFDLRWGYWKNVLINIGGFIPLGFLFCAYFSSARQIERPTLLTILSGATVSLIIEVLQAFLPTRDSGTTDLITNTLGTCLGVMFYRWKPSILTVILNRVPFTA